MARLTRKQIRSITRRLINQNFTFSDLSRRFQNVDSSTGNIYCPFHENTETPAAKMYWDEEREIWILHCFGQCHRNYTAFDYVELILCDRYQSYKSPLDFLKQKMDPAELGIQFSSCKKYLMEASESRFRARQRYIDEVAEKNESLTDYIEALYTA